MKTRNIKAAGVFLLGFLLLTAVNAQSPRQGGRGQGAFEGGKFPGHAYARLDLSEEQQEKMTDLRTEHYKTITPLRNKMGELRARERTLLSEESVDMNALNLTIDEQTDLMNSMKKMQVQHRLAVKDILTDEQLMKLQQGRQFAHQKGFQDKRGQRGAGINRGTRAGRGYGGI